MDWRELKVMNFLRRLWGMSFEISNRFFSVAKVIGLVRDCP